MRKVNRYGWQGHSKKILTLTVHFSLFTFGSLTGQSLQELLSEAERNNPGIQAYELRYAIASEKVQEVNSLPETEFGVGIFISEPETRTGAQKMRFSARQMFPWFGTITAREQYAASMADAEYEEVVIAKRRLAMQVSQAYYMLYSIRASQEVVDENIELLKSYERLVLTAVEVGNASAVDVLRLQIRMNELEQRKLVLEEEYKASQASLNALMNRKEGLAIMVTDSLWIPNEDVTTLSDSLMLHPELLKYDRLYQSVLQAEALNQKEAGPRVGVGLDYLPVAERPNMNFSDNGKDIVMPMVSLSVPVFTNTYRSRTKQNELRQKELLNQKQERQNMLNTMLANALANRNSARIAYETDTRNLKQAKDAEEILIRNYETGTINFNDVLDVQELQLKFQLNRLASLKEYFIYGSTINYLAGKNSPE